MRREATTDNASLKKGDMAREGLLGIYSSEPPRRKATIRPAFLAAA